MATVEDALRLFDGFSAPLNRILNALDLTNSALEDMQRLSTSPVDTSAIDGMRDAVLEAGAAYRQMLNEMERVRQNVENSACNVSPVDLLAALRIGSIDPSVPPVDIPVNPPVIPPVTWSSNNLDVFTSSGAERYELEIQSANDMLERLNDMQSQITQQAESVSFLPADAVIDIQMLHNRIENLRTAIQQTEQNPLDIDSDKANAQLENLRSQLDQIRNSQVSLNNAMQGMNIENI